MGSVQTVFSEPLVSHTFCNGVYARTIHMLAGTFIVGMRHKTKHLNIITKGRLNVDSGDGNVELVEAPCMFESDAGVQKVLYIFEDTDWTTIHATEETDVDKISEFTVYNSEESMKYLKESKRGMLCLGD